MKRIYTEDINRNGILSILDSLFEAYTVIPSLGRYKGQNESGLVIELIDADSAKVLAAAKRIKNMNKQDSVLVTEESLKAQFV